MTDETLAQKIAAAGRSKWQPSEASTILCLNCFILRKPWCSGSLTTAQRGILLYSAMGRGLLDKNCNVTSKGQRLTIGLLN